MQFSKYILMDIQTHQWEDLEKKRIPLSTRIPFEGWTEITHGKGPDLTLAHYLAARHIIFSLPVPHRVKDAVVINSPTWIRNDLNKWNRDTGHLRLTYGFGDIRVRKPMIAIAGSVSHLYEYFERSKPNLEKLALVIFEMGCDVGLVKVTEELR